MPILDNMIRIAGQWRLLMWFYNLIGATADACTFQFRKYFQIRKDGREIENYISYISDEKSAEEVRSVADGFREIYILQAGLSDIEMRISHGDLMAAREEEEESETDQDDVILRLLEATKNGNELDFMEILLTNTDSFRYSASTNGDTTIHQAVRTGNKNIFKQLLQSAKVQFRCLGQSIKYRSLLQTPNNKGDTALHTALKHHHKEMAFDLIKEAPDIAYMLNDRGMSPFYLAIKAEYKDLVEVVFQQAARCRFGQYRIEKLLRAKKSPISCAIKARDTGMLRVLVDNVPQLMNISDRKGRSPLSYAARNGYIDKVCYFLDKFPDRGSDHCFPIHQAVAGGHLDIVKKFFITLSCNDILY